MGFYCIYTYILYYTIGSRFCVLIFFAFFLWLFYSLTHELVIRYTSLYINEKKLYSHLKLNLKKYFITNWKVSGLYKLRIRLFDKHEIRFT